MPRNLITGSAILLLISAFALVWHNSNHKNSKPAGLNFGNNFLSPEQKFLVCGRFDVNSATMEELESIPRIGPSLAKKIYEFRFQRGSIANLDELLEVKGVGPGILGVIRRYLYAGQFSRGHESCN